MRAPLQVRSTIYSEQRAGSLARVYPPRESYLGVFLLRTPKSHSVQRSTGEAAPGGREVVSVAAGSNVATSGAGATAPRVSTPSPR